MQLLSALPFLASCATVLAQSTTIPEGYQWEVINWQAACGRQSCNYNFNVSGPNIDVYPGFLMYCNGDDSGLFETCERVGGESTNGIPTVKAMMAPRGEGQDETVVRVGISLMWTNAAATYNVTGTYDAKYNAFAGPLENFTVVPDSVVLSH